MKQVAFLVMALFLAGPGLAGDPADLSKPVKLSPEVLAKLGDPSVQVSAHKAMAQDPNLELLKGVVSSHLVDTGFTVVEISPVQIPVAGTKASSSLEPRGGPVQTTQADLLVLFEVVPPRLEKREPACSASVSILEANTGIKLGADVAIEPNRGPADTDMKAACVQALKAAVARAVTSAVDNLLHESETGWTFVITVENSPANLDIVLGNGLRKLCAFRKVTPYENHKLVATAQCKIDESEFTARLREMLEAASPKREFELSLKRRRSLAVRFR